jgi:hypothetical protein
MIIFDTSLAESCFSPLTRLYSSPLPGLKLKTLNPDRCPLNGNFNPGPPDCHVKLLHLQPKQCYLMKLNMSIRKVEIARSI